MSKTSLVVLFACSLARAAIAQPIATPPPTPPPDPVLTPTVAPTVVVDARPEVPTTPPHAVVATLGFAAGNAQVGRTDGGSIGVGGSFGYRLGDVTARALVDYYSVGNGGAMPIHGRATRLGGAARYAFAHTGYDSDAALDFWGELGVGYEHVAWHGGGVLDRPSYEGAFGFDLGARGARHANRRAYGGTYLAFRTLVAQAPVEAGAMATCAGPCTSATRPTTTDVTMFFELGAEWGR